MTFKSRMAVSSSAGAAWLEPAAAVMFVFAVAGADDGDPAVAVLVDTAEDEGFGVTPLSVAALPGTGKLLELGKTTVPGRLIGAGFEAPPGRAVVFVADDEMAVPSDSATLDCDSISEEVSSMPDSTTVSELSASWARVSPVQPK